MLWYGDGTNQFREIQPSNNAAKTFSELSFHASCSKGRVIPYLKLGIQMLPTSHLSFSAWVPTFTFEGMK
jgi:hypothetical protein